MANTSLPSANTSTYFTQCLYGNQMREHRPPRGQPFAYHSTVTPTRYHHGMNTHHYSPTQPTIQQSIHSQITAELGAKAAIDPATEVKSRCQFIADYLQSTGANALVLGISGGQDSTLTGRLCQMAVNQLNIQDPTREKPYQFIAIRLPYGVQADEQDAQIALRFIQPTRSITINIKESTDALAADAARALRLEEITDFNKGNIKARQRMVAQYAVAGQVGGLVVGTDHGAEAITGFYTKHGDGAADLMPLAGLSKRQGAAMLQYLGAPESTWKKVPTADLEDDRPALPDEVALGVRYADIDAYLESSVDGTDVAPEAVQRIEQLWMRSRHKRHLPVTPQDTWWQPPLQE